MARLFSPARDVWQQDSLLNWRKKLNLLRAGKATSNLRIGIYGSSVDRGTDETASPYNSQFQNSVAQWLAKLIADEGYVASSNNLFGSGTTTPADLTLRDSRFAATGGFVFGSGAVPGGQGFTSSSAGTLTFTTIGDCNTADIYWRDSSTGRQFSWAVDGGGATTISSTNVAQYNKTTIPLGSVASHSLVITWVAGGVEIEGVDFYDNTRKEITVWQHACNGQQMASMVSENGAPNGGRLTFLAKYPVDLAGGTLGMTNSWRFAEGITTTYNNMKIWIAAQQAAGASTFWVTPPYDGGSTGETALQDQYVAKGLQACMETGTAVVDWRAASKSFAAATAAGFVGDNTHLTEYNGAVDMARHIRACLFP